jgi:GntR family transcriptional regulator/MocR family aminotransferase
MRSQGWTALYDWGVDRESSTPIFRQIYLQIRSGILSRTFAPGTKLPSTRALAARLAVARASVVAAYEQLFAEGYLSGRVGSGTYISSDLPEPIEKAPARTSARPISGARTVPRRLQESDDFAEAMVQWDDRPFNTGRTLVDARTAEVWRLLTNRSLRSFGSSHLGYSDPCGFIELRTAICEYLRAARGVRCDPEQVIVTAGTQQAVDIAIRVLLCPGDEVWVEDPGYPLIHGALAAAGARLRPVPVDVQGMDVAAAIRMAPKAAAAVVTPSHQFPMGVTLSMARRLELLDWARRARAWIIEDDYASEYRYAGRPLASLQGLDDGGRVIYVGTLNKTLFPGLRIGYAVVPHALLRAFVSARYLMDRQPPSLSQIVAAEFMQQGYFAAHIRRMRLVYRDLRDRLAAELSHRTGAYVTLDVPDQGIHMVAYLSRGRSDVEVELSARRNGVVVRAMSRLYRQAPPRSGLILGFTGYPHALMVPAVMRLARVLQAQQTLFHQGGDRRQP